MNESARLRVLPTLNKLYKWGEEQLTHDHY